ncbi:MAG: hypothetical protein JST53_08075 [Actinobacteria bacterium]|nr:hypothetical protein [Actinomycetota bacterium]
METVLVFHEVDDVDHWLSSPKREEILGPMGVTVRTFKDPDDSNRTALILEVPSREQFEEALRGEEAAEAMKFDGVRPETVLVLEEVLP